LKECHNSDNIFLILVEVYFEINWDVHICRSVPFSFLDSLENQRKFLDRISLKFQIKTQQDWKQITLKEIIECNGLRLTNKYNGNIISLLFMVYPEINWTFMETNKHKILFEIAENFWNSFENKRKFFDNISHQFKIKTQQDWKQVTLKEMREFKLGETNNYNNILFSTLVEIYPVILNLDIFEKNIPNYFWNDLEYDDLFTILVEIYPEINWNILCKIVVPNNFLNIFANKRFFLDNFSNQFQIKTKKYWKQITLKEMKEHSFFVNN